MASGTEDYKVHLQKLKKERIEKAAVQLLASIVTDAAFRVEDSDAVKLAIDLADELIEQLDDTYQVKR